MTPGPVTRTPSRALAILLGAALAVGGVSASEAIVSPASAATHPCGAGFAPSGSVTISGEVEVGKTLGIAFPKSSKLRKNASSYEWRVGGVVVGTDPTYVPHLEDAGDRIEVRVTSTVEGEETVACERTAPVAFTPPVPTLEGTPKVAAILEADAGDWDEIPARTSVSLAFQWRVAGKPVKGATSGTYQVKLADAGKKVQLEVIPDHPDAKPVTSKAVTIPYERYAGVGTPKISGAAKVGATLKASVGTWAPAKDSTFSYQWYRGSTPIDGAVEREYTLTKADLGAAISVKVTASHLGYVAKSASSSKVHLPIRPGTPVITGVPAVGQQLGVSVGTWTPKPMFSYQWYRGAKAIRGATGSKYRVVAADFGQAISVQVTGAKDGWPSSTVRSASITIGAVTPGSVQIVGTAKLDARLTAKLSGWSPSTGITYRYRWLRDGVAIKSATKASYTLTAADADARISVMVAASGKGFDDVSKASASVGFLPTGTIKLVEKDGTLRIDKTRWPSSRHKYHLKYQWNCDGVPIPGVTNSVSWYVPDRYRGKRISVTVTAEVPGFTPATYTTPGKRVL